MRALGDSKQAIEELHLALEEINYLGSLFKKEARGLIAICHSDLADNLATIGQFDEAQSHYETALSILQGIGDRRNVSVLSAKLGVLAQERGDLVRAQELHAKALSSFRDLSEPGQEATALYHLGRAAQDAQDWIVAERYYRESLKIKEMMNDLPGIARTYNQLGRVAEGAGPFEAAERWYLQAQKIEDRINPKQYFTLSNLANIYLVQNRLDEARRYAERAKTIIETLEISIETGRIYDILAQISAKQGLTEEATLWWNKRNTSRDNFAGTRYELAPLLQVFNQQITIAALACTGDPQAKAAIENSFKLFGEIGLPLLFAIQRIWAGERDPDVLAANIDYKHRAIVLAILHCLGVKVPHVIQEIMDGALSSVPSQDQTQE